MKLGEIRVINNDIVNFSEQKKDSERKLRASKKKLQDEFGKETFLTTFDKFLNNVNENHEWKRKNQIRTTYTQISINIHVDSRFEQVFSLKDILVNPSLFLLRPFSPAGCPKQPKSCRRQNSQASLPSFLNLLPV